MKSCIGVLAITLSLAWLSPVRADTASHEAAAKKLLATLNMREMMDKGIQQVLEMQIRQQPAIAPYRQTMLEFLQKYMSWDTLEGDLVKLYTDTFTEDEINQLIAFYDTPVGKKAVKALPELMMKGAQLGQMRVQQHIGELQQAIMKQAQENAGGASSRPATTKPIGASTRPSAAPAREE
jgi:hypothetical protein